MIADGGLAWVFTAWFAILAVVSGIGALRAQNAADRLSYAAHVVMLAAMAIMPWHWFMAVPALAWIALFTAAAAGYAILALVRRGVVVGPGAGHHASRAVAWYHVAMMLGMAWMVVQMDLAQRAVGPVLVPLGAGASIGHAHGAASPLVAGLVEVPPLWQLPLWAVGTTIAFAAMFAIAGLWFLTRLRAAPTGTRPGEALPARAELVVGAAIAVGMASSYFLMS